MAFQKLIIKKMALYNASDSAKVDRKKDKASLQ